MAPERLDDRINSASMDLNPFVGPGENYLIFQSTRSGGFGCSDLYITFKQDDGTWSEAMNMGPRVNSSAGEGSPYVFPDGLYLFFNSDREQQYDRNPYWMSADIIRELSPFD